MARPAPTPAIFDLADLPPRQDLEHELGEALDELARLRRRRHLRRDDRYRELEPELARLLQGFAWDTTIAPRPPTLPRRIRAVAWNIERGKRFAALRGAIDQDPLIRDADLLLLTELDIGMGRSQNLDVPRELAAHLGMSYVFANQHVVLSPGDSGERDHGVANRLGLHGCALLSRLPIRRFCAVTLPEYKDKFHALEKRLGDKRAILAEVEVEGGVVTVAVVHLDPFAPARHRARQLRRILRAAAAFDDRRLLLGGDLNTSTYDFGSSIGLTLNLMHKALRFGFEGTIDQYMRPGEVFERAVFRALEAAGLTTEGYNDPAVGTIYYNVNDPEVIGKTLEYVPKALWSWLQRRLEPRGGIVPFRFDWFAGRGLAPSAPRVIERPSWRGVQVSDHNPIVVEVEPGAEAEAEAWTPEPRRLRASSRLRSRLALRRAVDLRP
ncbi:MAG: endonuclease/exonuclease/phosphatase family protein [Myxococcales bacterium]|nr:endonuclease/exonuclease/phosphatase family protein [Myxococcales bacterium]